jgi:hypothetical protein
MTLMSRLSSFAIESIALASLSRAASICPGSLPKFPAISSDASSKASPIACNVSGPNAAPSISRLSFMTLPHSRFPFFAELALSPFECSKGAKTCSLSVLLLHISHRRPLPCERVSFPVRQVASSAGGNYREGACVAYRKGELSKATMQEWPHQVAFPAYQCLGHNYHDPLLLRRRAIVLVHPLPRIP